MRPFLVLILFALLSPCVLAERPNIILMLGDDSGCVCDEKQGNQNGSDACLKATRKESFR